MEHNPQTGSTRDFLTILFKHKYKILTVFLATVITVTVGSFLLPPVFEAKSSLMVKMGREYMYSPEVGDAKPSISFQSVNQQEVISSELQILTSRDLIEKVINTIGVNTIYPDVVKDPPMRIKPIEAAILGFEKHISAENIKKSNVIEVSFRHKDPEIAANAVNQLVEFYKEKHLQVLSSPKSSFIEQQLNTYQQKMEESENNFEAFKQKYRIVSLDQQRSLLLKQRMDLDTSLKTIQNRFNELEKILASPELLLTSQDARYFPQSERYKVIDDAKSKLLSLQLREKELLGKYEESSRLIGNIRKEIRLVQEFILDQEKNLVESELASLGSQRVTIKSQLDQLDKEMKDLDLREKELLNLKREVASNESNYKVYLSKFEEARISDDMDQQKIANISVIQEAVAPVKPIKPRKGLNIALSIILGLLSGLGLAFFSEYLSQGLSTPESAQRRLGLPVLTSFSFAHSSKQKSSRLTWGLSTSALIILLAGVLWVYPGKEVISSWWDTSVLNKNIKEKSMLSKTDDTLHSLEDESFALVSKSSSINNDVTPNKIGNPAVSDAVADSPERTDNPSVSAFREYVVNKIKKDPAAPIKDISEQKEDDPIAAPAQIAALRTDFNNPWVVNMHSGLSKGYAIGLLKKMKKDGNDAYVTRFKDKTKDWYRVRVGFFPTRENALETGKGLSEKYSLPDFWIARAPRNEMRAQ